MINLQDLVLVRRTEPHEIYYLRAKPRTATDPTAFGKLASQVRGKDLVSELPPAVQMVKKMRGKKFGRTRKLKNGK